MPTTDSFNLERFLTAQAPVIETVLAELRRAENKPTGCGSFSRNCAVSVIPRLLSFTALVLSRRRAPTSPTRFWDQDLNSARTQ